MGRRPDGTGIKPKLYSKDTNLARLDGRTTEAQYIRALRDALLEHVSNAPTITERLLIERLCLLGLKIALVDKKIVEGTDTQFDGQQYLAWTGHFVRTLKLLGLKPGDRKNSVNIEDLLSLKKGRAA